MHDMVTLNNGKYYLGMYVSLMVDSDLYSLAVKLIINNVSHSSNYNSDLLQKILKETFELEIYRFTKSVASEPPIWQQMWHASYPTGPSKLTVKCTS